ncbi:hypothetical protein ACJ41O_005056 [Fusarium nematophilum]
MSPPPSTPTPRRFLLAKRGTQSSQTPTGPPRFQSTPRFSSSSVLRSSTQGRAGTGIEDVEEVEEVEDAAGESSAGDGDGEAHHPLNDSIEVESSDDMTASRDGSLAVSGDESELADRETVEHESPGASSLRHETCSPLEEREPKRRKVVSISPVPERSSSPLLGGYPENKNAASFDQEAQHAPPAESVVHDAVVVARGDYETKAPQQPTFRPPPRFKPAEVDPTAAEGLPAAFSPQRRGAKYVAGGLAAELQGWLSEVKGWEGAVPPAASTIRFVVEEFRPGRRMYLVKGRTEVSPATTAKKKLLLAGEGRLTGLGQRAAVGVGSVVEVGQPVWDVELDGETWTVACDWGLS